jgi:lipopolysaccharide export system permease protein
MLLYHKYITKNILLSSLVILFVVTMIIWLTQSSRFVDLIISSGISFLSFLKLTMYLLPPIILLVSPVTLFIGIVYIYNKLYLNSELLTLSAAGLSKYKILKPALFTASLVMLFNYFISFYLLPVSNYEFTELRKFYKNNYISFLIHEGIFAQPTKNITIYVASKGVNELLEDVFIHDTSDPENQVTINAKTGRFFKKDNRTILFLSDGNRQQIDKKDNYHLLNFKTLELDLELGSSQKNKRTLSIGEMHLKELLFSKSNQIEKIRLNKMRAEAHNRIIWPLLNLIFALIAVDSIVGGEFSRMGKKKRIFHSSIILIILLVIVISANNLGAKHPVLVPLQYLILITFTFFFTKRFKALEYQ